MYLVYYMDLLKQSTFGFPDFVILMEKTIFSAKKFLKAVIHSQQQYGKTSFITLILQR